MALFQYRKGSAMTRSCDTDGASLCADSFPEEPGTNSLKKTGECLIAAVEKIASPVCKKIVGIASTHEESEDTFEASLAQVRERLVPIRRPRTHTLTHTLTHIHTHTHTHPGACSERESPGRKCHSCL